MTLEAGRLRLVALDPALARLQRDKGRAFFNAIGAQPEAAWPPDYFDADQIVDRLESSPDEAGWSAWVCLMGWAPGSPDRAVGMGGFHGRPDAKGAVELTYAMLPSFREQGLATETVEALAGWAFSHPEVTKIVAQTEPHLTASRRVLEKTGFSECGEAVASDSRPRIVYERLRLDD